MNFILNLITACLFLLNFNLFLTAQPININPQDDALFQYSTKNAFLKRIYDGDLSFGELKRAGNFGLGTFNGIDGEMAAINGEYYRISVNGAVNKADDNDLTPFAVVKFFNPDQSYSLTGNYDLGALQRIILQSMKDTLKPSAVKVTGKFEYVKTRSVAKQALPYPPLEEIINNQSVFKFENVSGIISGFWFPEFFDGINFPGFHFHFLLEDYSGGGHLLNCKITDVNIEIDYASKVIIQ